MNIDWANPPYCHERWEKNIDSIMSPGTKVTFPLFIVEMVFFNRSTYIKGFQKINKGNGWSVGVAKQVRALAQQAHAICNYFPFPTSEPLVIVAFKNFFRNNRVMKIGQFRKCRVTKEDKCNITLDEKDLIKGVWAELDRLIKQRDSFVKTEITYPIDKTKEVTFRSNNEISNGKKSLADLMKLEQSIHNKKE